MQVKIVSSYKFSLLISVGLSLVVAAKYVNLAHRSADMHVDLTNMQLDGFTSPAHNSTSSFIRQ